MELDYNKKVTLDYSINTLFDLRNQRLKHDTEILTINYEGLKTSVKRFNADIFYMSPPCQDDSRVNPKKKTKNPDSILGRLVFETLKFIEACQPLVIVFENVTDYAKHKRIEFTKQLEKLNYNVKWVTWEAHLFGSVQKRKRIFMFAMLGQPFKFLPIPKLHNKRLKDVLQPAESSSGFNTSPRLLSDFQTAPIDKWFRANVTQGCFFGEDRYYYTEVEKGKGNYILSKGKYIKSKTGNYLKKKRHDNAIRLDSNGFVPTIVNPTRNWFVHPSGKRVCSMDELKLMAGFYKEFKFILNSKKTYGQILADTVDPYQAEFNTWNIMTNLNL